MGLAIFNLMIAWLMELDRRTCTIGPYPIRGTYLIEPGVLLISCFSISMNRRWGSAVALLISGYAVGCYVRFLLVDNGLTNVLAYWTHSEATHLSRQVVLALIVFGYSAISLTRICVTGGGLESAS